MKLGLSSLVRHLLPPKYSGRLTYRGEIAASAAATVRVKLTVDRPGCYALTSWSLDSEVGEIPDDGTSWRTRQWYTKRSRPTEHSSLTVVDTV